MASTAGTSLSKNANDLYEKNYHGQLAQGIGQAYTTAAQKAEAIKKQYNEREGGYGGGRDDEYGEEEMTGQVS